MEEVSELSVVRNHPLQSWSLSEQGGERGLYEYHTGTRTPGRGGNIMRSYFQITPIQEKCECIYFYYLAYCTVHERLTIRVQCSHSLAASPEVARISAPEIWYRIYHKNLCRSLISGGGPISGFRDKRP